MLTLSQPGLANADRIGEGDAALDVQRQVASLVLGSCGVEQPVAHRRTALLIVVVVLGGVGCGGYVHRGRHLYQEGRYIEAAEVLEQNERRVAEETPSQQAEYATYRGLSMLILGNYPEASRWMTFAYSLERARPGTLKPERKVELDRGWNELSMRHRTGFPVTPRDAALSGPAR